jgi:hypothetical protein
MFLQCLYGQVQGPIQQVIHAGNHWVGVDNFNQDGKVVMFGDMEYLDHRPVGRGLQQLFGNGCPVALTDKEMLTFGKQDFHRFLATTRPSTPALRLKQSQNLVTVDVVDVYPQTGFVVCGLRLLAFFLERRKGVSIDLIRRMVWKQDKYVLSLSLHLYLHLYLSSRLSLRLSFSLLSVSPPCYNPFRFLLV